jgi:hypothetical protein
METMTKIEFDRVQRLLDKEEKVLIEQEKARSKRYMAEFENDLVQRYPPNEDPVFARLHQQIEEFSARINKAIAARCRELGIAKQSMPSYYGHWSERGENCIKERRDELRLAAKTLCDADEAERVSKVKLQCLEVHQKLVVEGMTTERAHAFIAALPDIGTLVPRPAFEEIVNSANPPIAEQLVQSPGARRQQRYRERLAAASREHNGDVIEASRDALSDALDNVTPLRCIAGKDDAGGES